MRLSLIVILAALLMPVAAQQPSPRELFERARLLEESNRNLDEAIARYEQVTAQSVDRELAADAQLRAGLLYERLGRAADAQRAFQIVATRYPESANLVEEARRRLARLDPPRRGDGMSSRQVWTVPEPAVIYGAVSHDGRHVPYVDWSRNGDLFLHDIASGANQHINNNRSGDGFEFAQFGGAFSPDDAQLAYGWFNKKHFELRVARVQQTGAASPRILLSNPEMPVISPEDWSPDGRWVAVQLQRNDKTAQIGLVDVQDGSFRALKSVEWRGSTTLSFSPDSKYLAYDLPAADTSDRRDVFILAVDGSRDTPAVVHSSDDTVMGWSPDGRQLLFTSDRTGSMGLWGLTVVDGKPQGTPQQIKADVSGNSMGLARSGTLYTLVRHSRFAVTRSDIHVAAFDFDRGRLLPTSRSVVQAFVGANNFPAWSADGKYLAFLSTRRLETGNRVIVIQSQETGDLRELRSGLNVYAGGPGPQWAPDGLSLAIQATDSKGRKGLFRIDATTGEATPMALSTRGPVGDGEIFTGPMWAPDGKRIYYSRIDPAGDSMAVVERDLSSGNETEVFRSTAVRPVANVLLSPDGRFLAAADGDWFAGAPVEPGTARRWSIALIPVEGGEPKALMSDESHGGGILMWAPDSRSVFIYSITNKSSWQREVWRVAIDGTEPQKLDLNVNFLGPLGNSDQRLHVHPDGRRVAFATSEPPKPDEVWALEKFLPRPSRAATRP